MNNGAAFTFDEETQSALTKTWALLADAGLPDTMVRLDYPPHMTFLMADQADMAMMRTALAYYCDQNHPVEIEFSSIGIFLGRRTSVFASPVIHPELLSLHDSFWRSVLPCVQRPDPVYRPGAWVPHVTIGFNLDPAQAAQAVQILTRHSLPRKGWITGLIFGSFVVEGESCLETLKLKPN